MSAVPAPARIRAPRPYDAAALLELKHQPDRETAFMMYEPGERDTPVRDLAAEPASLGQSANCVLYPSPRHLRSYLAARSESVCPLRV